MTREAYKQLVDEIERFEGFRSMPYKDYLGYPTIGFGTKLPLSKVEAELLLEHRLNKSIRALKDAKPFIEDLPDEAQVILYDMAYNMGIPRLLKFHKMFKALEKRDFCRAADEMKDSRWYNQVGHRAQNLVKRMRALCSNNQE